MKTIIEVGAHAGEDTARLLDGGKNRVFAFEPFPNLIARLQEKFKEHENFFPVPMAVDSTPGWRWLNLAPNNASGVSSLHELSTDVAANWPGMITSFVDRRRVMATRLDTFIKTHDIKQIDYLWIDAQGNDFEVLKSLGSEIKRVREGKCEAAYTYSLYENVSNSYTDIAAWLEKRGFEVLIVPDGGQKECDVHFRRKR